MHSNIYQSGIRITADTGFANEANMQYLHEQQINAYILDNRFRSRDPRFAEQKTRHGKRHQDTKLKSEDRRFSASEFSFEPTTNTCICPAGESLTYHGRSTENNGRKLARFEGRLLQCVPCELKHRCMRNPSAADDRTGKGRQVAFTVSKPPTQPYTHWMMQRIDSQEGKQIYSQRMAVVEPVFGNIGSNKRLNRFSLRGRNKYRDNGSCSV